MVSNTRTGGTSCTAAYKPTKLGLKFNPAFSGLAYARDLVRTEHVKFHLSQEENQQWQFFNARTGIEVHWGCGFGSARIAELTGLSICQACVFFELPSCSNVEMRAM